MQHNRLPAFAIFFGSFLLFGVQPMLGRTLLPSFGGTAAVWTVCLAAYQTLLVAGYFYAHVVAKRPLRMQRTLHVSLLALAAVWTAAFAFGRPMLKTFAAAEMLPNSEFRTNSRICWRSFRFVMHRVYKSDVGASLFNLRSGP